tara:strand:+ start:6511 stop:8844 length:2334 start_codon:yes stop_codon:yes gene_type:complete
MADDLRQKLLDANFTEEDIKRFIDRTKSTPIDNKYGVQAKPDSKEVEDFIQRQKVAPRKMVGKRDLGPEARGLSKETEQIADQLDIEKQFTDLSEIDDMQDYSSFLDNAGNPDVSPVSTRADVPSSQNRSMVANQSSDIKKYLHTPTLDKTPALSNMSGSVGDDAIKALFRSVPKKSIGPLLKKLGLTAAGGTAALMVEGADAEPLSQDADLTPGNFRIQHQRDNESRTNPYEGHEKGSTFLDRLMATGGELDMELEGKNRQVGTGSRRVQDQIGSEAKGAAWFGGEQVNNDWNDQQEQADITGQEQAVASLPGNREAIASDGEATQDILDAGKNDAWNNIADAKTNGTIAYDGDNEAPPAYMMVDGADDPSENMIPFARPPEEDTAPIDGSKGRADKRREAENNKGRDLAGLYADQLKGARDADASSKGSLAMQRAATQIGAAFGDIKPDYSGIDALSKDRPDSVKQFQENLALDAKSRKDEKEDKKDAFMDSPLADKMFKSVGLTAAQASMFGINASQILSMTHKEKMAATAAGAKLKAAELKAAQGRTKMESGNKKILLDAYARMDSLKGRSSIFSKLETKLKNIDEIKATLKGWRDGSMKMNSQSALDLSAVWSKALTDGVPATSLIFGSMPITLKSKLADWTNFALNKPAINFYSDKNIKQMEDQINVLEKVTLRSKAERQHMTLMGLSNVYGNNPTELDLVKMKYGRLLDFDESGRPKIKGNYQLKGETGKSSVGISKKKAMDYYNRIGKNKFGSFEEMADDLMNRGHSIR